MQKKLSLIIKANQDFIRHTGDDELINAPILNSFYESITNIYIPLLNMIAKLEEQSIPCKFGLVIPPVLCNMLSDENIQNSYVTWLEERKEFGLKELERNSTDEKIKENIKNQIEVYTKTAESFIETYHSNLIPVFAEYMRNGSIELLGTTGTDIFMPHYADLKEIISAQIESGLHAYRQFFGVIPEGFWLPDFGYTPGVEKLIRAYGYTYTILDTRSILLADKVPETGIFYPVRTENSLVIFGRDLESDITLFGEEGLSLNEVYKNQNRDVGFELPTEQLSSVLKGNVRYSTGFRYWNRCFKDENSIYNQTSANNQILEDAKVFIQKRNEKLSKASELLSDKEFVCDICTFDADKLSKDWAEGIQWFENLFIVAKDYDFEFSFCSSLCENQYDLEKINPYYSAGIGSGYGENLLSSKNSWMMRYIHKACERMIDLSDRFPNDTGLKTRLLNLGAKELMLAQSSNLAKSIQNDDFPEFAERRFKESITAFTAVFDSLGSNTVSTEWLTTLEARDSIFPWMNYRIFSKKR